MNAQLNEQNALSLRELCCNRRVFKPLLISIAVMFFQQLSGANPLAFYGSEIFASAGWSGDPDSPAMIVGAVFVVMTLLSCIVADVAGRRVLLMLSGTFMTASLATLGLYFFVAEEHQVEPLSVCLSCLSVCLSDE